MATCAAGNAVMNGPAAVEVAGSTSVPAVDVNVDTKAVRENSVGVVVVTSMTMAPVSVDSASARLVMGDLQFTCLFGFWL